MPRHCLSKWQSEERLNSNPDLECFTSKQITDIVYKNNNNSLSLIAEENKKTKTKNSENFLSRHNCPEFEGFLFLKFWERKGKWYVEEKAFGTEGCRIQFDNRDPHGAAQF